MESTALLLEFKDPPILVCVKLFTSGLQRDTETYLKCVPDQ